ncbi:unnamed protein product, partial [Didymodactylos carnosus]
MDNSENSDTDDQNLSDTNNPSKEQHSLKLKTVREFDEFIEQEIGDVFYSKYYLFIEELQELKRENFNLKLRIYFLEEHSTVAGTSTELVEQLRAECASLKQQLNQKVTGPDGEVNSDISTNIHLTDDEEYKSLSAELEHLRKNYEKLLTSHQQQTQEQPLMMSMNKSNLTHSIQTDSGLETTSDYVTSSLNVGTLDQQKFRDAENRGYKNGQRQAQRRIDELNEQINNMRKQVHVSYTNQNNDQLESELNQTRKQLADCKRQCSDFEIKVNTYKEQQSKAERVITLLKNEYDQKIASLTRERIEQQPQTEQHYESSIDVEAYKNTLADRDRMVQQLEESINELTIRLRNPITVTLPSTTITDESSRLLMEELRGEIQTHLGIVETLRAECIELKRSEKNLKLQIEQLLVMFDVPVPREQSGGSNVLNDSQMIHIKDLKSAIIQINTNLINDAENLTSLTNRVTSLIREQDEWQGKLERLQQQITEKNDYIQQLERRESELEVTIKLRF